MSLQGDCPLMLRNSQDIYASSTTYNHTVAISLFTVDFLQHMMQKEDNASMICTMSSCSFNKNKKCFYNKCYFECKQKHICCAAYAFIIVLSAALALIAFHDNQKLVALQC